MGAITDLAAFLKATDPESKLAKLAKSVWPAYDSEKDAIHASRSAIRWPDKIRKPILIMHGGEDILSPLHSLKMAEALTELKRPYSLVIFASDDHILSRNRHTRDRLAVDWFNQHRSGVR